ncbi:MAG: SH3 domain-containing protein [Clostridia bacterium]|nr:SH3 domain-containing protein [Clostridia bacterium]
MKKAIKKISAIALAAVILMTAALTANAYTTEEIVQATSEFIISQEGTYTTVDPNDSGALSIGLLGWHATRALNLLKAIVNADPDTAESVLGASLYNEVVSYSSWNSRTLDAEEAIAVSRLLGTNAGKSVQDTLIKRDVTQYITDAQARGITNAQALILYADIENQCGGGVSYAVGSAAANTAGSFGAITLDILYQAAMNNGTAGRYATRRRNGYEFAKSHFTGQSSSPEEDPTTKVSTDGAGVYTVTATLLNVRSQPTSSSEKVGQLPQGTRITVTGTQNGWAKFSEGWVYMEYLSKVSETTTAPATTAPETTTAAASGGTKYMVNNSYLNVRSAPGTSNALVTTLKQGDIITITETKDGWGRYSGGWVYMSYLVMITEEPSAKATETTTAAPAGTKYKVTATVLNVRSAPGTSNPKVSSLNQGDVITVTETKDGWARFSAGWVSMEYLVKIAEETTTKAQDTGTKYIVTANNLNVRSAPGTSNPKISSLKQGDIITVTETKDGWGKFSGGWVSMEYLAKVTSEEGTTAASKTPVYPVYTITDDFLNVRAKPDADSEIVGALRKNARVTVTEIKGSWGKFAYEQGKYGWFSLAYAKLESTAKGDVNGDSKITADDARRALRISASLDTCSTGELAAADIDGDGKVLADDARRILRASANLEKI